MKNSLGIIIIIIIIGLVFWPRFGSPNLGQKTRPNNNQEKKRNCKIVDFAVPADHRITERM